ncbi:MAG: PDZ domain-containing protein [Phycisphaerae bacterium]|nr:PDZ domain-containing protein [Phycisphaerae bacterium]
MTHHAGLSCLLLLAMVSSAAARDTVEFYVAPDGSDAGDGSMERPFASLAQARDAVRQIRAENVERITVFLRGGNYYLEEPVVFTSADSGGGETIIEYCARADEEVVISGGFELDLGWRPYRDGIVSAKVPTRIGKIDQLFVDGRRQHPARYPNYDPEAKFFGGTSGNAISPQHARTWTHPEGGYMHALHSAMWGSKHYVIVGVDADGTIQFRGGWQENRGGGFDPVFRGGYHKDYLFVENLFEEVDAPGEWYFDVRTKTLYLMPEPDVAPSQAQVIGAGLKELVLIRGTPDEPVRNLHFRGLRFRHTQRIFMEPYERLLRGDWSIARLGALHIEGAEDCSVRDCHFEDLGGNGVFLSRYNRRVRVESCRFTRLGESCVCLVGDVGAVRSPAIEYGTTLRQDQIDLTPGPKSPDYPAQCTIHDNLMHDFGFIGKQVAGVFVSMSEQITVSHNTIYRCPRAAICINDGCWGGHLIEHNDVFHTVRESGDHGPFNSWGRDRWWKTSYNGGRDIEPFARERATLDNYRTTIIRNNRFAHSGSHSWGIDLDDGSSNYRVCENLCLGMGVKLREGFFRTVENNIIIDGFGGFHIWMPECDDVIARNIFVSDEPYQFIRANPANARQFDDNLFYSRNGQIRITGIEDGPLTLPQWQAKGFDSHSIVADPLFIDPDSGDYRVREDSPALKLGFRNFPMDRFGVLKPAFREEVAQEPRAFATAATKREENDLRDPKPVTWFGATIKNLTGEAEKSAAGIGRETGVLFVAVPARSSAADAGFRLGDVILKANGESIDSLDDLRRITTESRGRPVQFTVFNAVERTVMLQMPD